jgi:hypothetical protein
MNGAPFRGHHATDERPHGRVAGIDVFLTPGVPGRTMPAPMFEVRRGRLLATAALLTGCAAPRPPAQLSPQGSAVHVGTARPPSNARELGRVEGESGGGCAGFGTIGTYEPAEADLRNRTASMGGNYAEIVTVIPPHDTGDRCPDNRMIIQGVAYKTGNDAMGTATSNLLPSSAPGPATTACDPPCSPGYICNAGSCAALCNPPCGPGQVCRADRLCVPGG